MIFTVYAIKSSVDNRIYVGFTSNLERRIKEHNQGKTKSTKGDKPLIYKEPIDTRQAAREREKFLKSGVGKEFLKTL
jgi:putative endonuclease